MRLSNLTLITLILFSINSFCTELSKGTRIYNEPSLKSKYLTLKKGINVKLTPTKNKDWMNLKIKNKDWYLYTKGSSVKNSAAEGGPSNGSDYSSGEANHSGNLGSKTSSNKGRQSDKASSGKKGASTKSSKGPRGIKGSESGNSIQSTTPNQGRQAFPTSKKMTQAEALKERHDAAQREALAANKDFCSQCWYAKNGIDANRFEDTHPKLNESGEPVVPKNDSNSSGGAVVM